MAAALCSHLPDCASTSHRSRHRTTDALRPLQELMSRYQDRVRNFDRARDFAEATLVRLARRQPLSYILTVDHDDFETYAMGNRKRFAILPERRGKV